MDVVLLAAIFAGDDPDALPDSTGDASIRGLAASRQTGKDPGRTR